MLCTRLAKTLARDGGRQLLKNTMHWFSLYLVVISLIPAICLGSGVPSIPEYIALSEQTILKVWLSAHPEFRVALDADCDCANNIEKMRRGVGGAWKANPNYHPYYVAGDFNGDNKNDFAVMLINTNEGGKHYLAIFNGPHNSGTKPAYLRPEEGALFYGSPRPEPYRLIIGEFESEGVSFEPKGTSYEYSW